MPCYPLVKIVSDSAVVGLHAVTHADVRIITQRQLLVVVGQVSGHHVTPEGAGMDLYPATFCTDDTLICR